MTKTEFKKLISNSTNPTWFKEKKIELNSANANEFKISFNDVSSFYDFLFNEVKKWNDFQGEIPTELNDSKAYFERNKKAIENFVISFSDKESNYYDLNWNSVSRNFSLGIPIFNFDTIEVTFLLDLYNKNKTYYHGAYSFITNNLREVNSNKNNFIGATLANDFINKETFLKYSRKESEQKIFGNLKNEFQLAIENATKDVTEHLTNANNDYKEYVKSLDELKNEKDSSFQHWFATSKNAFDNFNTTSAKRIEELKKLYEEELALKAPAQYWEERANEMRIQGQWWLVGLTLSIIIGVICLYNLLNSIGVGEYEKMFKNTGSSIKWSIVFITFITFLAFLIRAFTKLTFSSFHLSRDAQERKQLTYVYLALKENNAVSDIDRNIVLQSIFSRADTGLLKEDSSPTMPNSIIEKVVKPS
ncbi:Probable transmembrane protein of unknown function [Flavobacterium indicum GPTSA100-9 = DSM 17447]|uniref:DUF6161 domain-containing protein n=1 Tax=Flavobacterium indicum (strain DSM 17447 / CIP 109464 / GPTSA100-9) TaxID=1094466 RepID=H8XSS7_FLAIG|nr:DUF6161 domain-containing protein [Flavobacterium indicum]CCG53469.1 Probable transmembrane protein of unknown function [Flavobacterium indicum GPTSA100-9 = DSM 17447]